MPDQVGAPRGRDTTPPHHLRSHLIIASRMSVLYDSRVVAVESRGLFRLWVRFADGTEGEADLSFWLDDPDSEGFFEPWRDPVFFSTVRVGDIGLGSAGVVWGNPDDCEDKWDAVWLSGDELYMEIHGLAPVEMHPEWHATKLVEAKPLEKYRVWMRFADGTEGAADFGDFAGKGVFNQWDDPDVWEGMRLSHGTVEWGPDDPTKVLDFCPDMLYKRVSGRTWEETRSAAFARVALERLLGSSDTPRLSDT